MRIDTRDIVRFYQHHSAHPLYVKRYRIRDGFGNKETLCIIFEIKGLEIVMRYSLYGSWEDSGTPFAISNLYQSKELPSSERKVFINDAVEENLVNQEYDMIGDNVNAFFNYIFSKVEAYLKKYKMLQ